jgi:6-phosphogluconolactonase
MRVNLLAAILLASLVCAAVQGGGKVNNSAPDHLFVYIGTAVYEGGSPTNDIYLANLNLTSGELTPLGIAGHAVNPGFIAIHPNRKFLYTTSEYGNYQGKKSGAVNAFSIDRQTGRLHLLNTVASGAPNPSFVALDKTSRYAAVSNYYGGVAVFPIEQDGKLGAVSSYMQETGSSVNRERQDAPHAHSVNFSPDNRFTIAADLGLDKLLVYRFDASTGKLSPNEFPFAKFEPGSGPRHFAFAPNGKFVYVINELQSTLTVLTYDPATARMHPIESVSTLPSDFHGPKSGAEVEVSSSGKFVYTSNRGHDSITVFAIKPDDGTVSAIQHESTQGKTPRNFEIDPTGRYLLVGDQDSDKVVVFRVDSQTGRLSPTGHSLAATAPVCIKFMEP